MSLLVVIPARLGSTRFPAKVLAPLAGLPVFERCRRAAARSACGDVVVAVDDARVREAVEGFGGTAVMTPASCPSGTDRVYKALLAVERRRGRRYRYVINLQGDEPLIRPGTLRRVASLLKAGAEMATAVVPSRAPEDAANPNVVKVAMSQDGRCLYFSRAGIPYLKPHVDSGRSVPKPLLRHIGVYGYSRDALERFVRLKPSPLEKRESLEQLRALEAGISIHAAVVADRAVAIDRPEDLRAAERVLRAAKRKGS